MPISLVPWIIMLVQLLQSLVDEVHALYRAIHPDFAPRKNLLKPPQTGRPPGRPDVSGRISDPLMHR